MALNDREQIHHQLLEALFKARKQVEYLEAALSHNAAYLGTGIEREYQQLADPEMLVAPDALIRYLELVEPEEDISDYIGSEGVDATRPRLGPDAPDLVRPKDKPRVSPLVRWLAQAHPDDSLPFPFKPGAIPSGTYFTNLRPGASEPGNAEAQPLPAPSEDGTSVPEESEKTAAPPRQPARAKGKKSIQRPLVPVQKSGEQKASPGSSLLVENVPAPHVPLSPVAAKEAAFSQVSGEVHEPRPSSGSLSVSPGICLTEPEGTRIQFGLPSAAQPRAQAHSCSAARPLTDEDCLRAHFALMALNKGVWDWNLRTGGVFLSTRWEEIVGKAPANLSSASDTLTFGLHPDDAAEVRKNIAALSQGRASRFTASVRFSTGQGKWGYGRLYALAQASGKQVSRITAVLSDAGEERKREEESKPALANAGDATLLGFFDKLEAGFVLFESPVGTAAEESGNAADFVLIAANPAFRALYPLPESIPPGFRLREAVGGDVEQWAHCLRSVLSGARSHSFPLSRQGTPELYEIGAFSPEPGRVACFIQNVTEIRKVEQEIRLNEGRLAALYHLSHMDEASEEQVVRYSLKEAVRLTGSELGYLYLVSGPEGEGGRVYWSHEVLASFGKEPAPPNFCLSPRENEGCLSLHGPEVVNAIGDAMSGAFGENVRVDRYILAPITEEGRIVCIAAVANKKAKYESSDLRQLELFINGMWFHLRRRWAVQHLQKAKEAAEAASRAKNEFLANVSHELRTPLNGMLGMLQVLQQSPLSKEQMECVTTANYSGRSLLRVISDILDFSRIEAGRFELSPQLFDFTATVRSTLGMFIYEAERKDIRFSLYLSKNIPDILIGDEGRVRQIIYNLVGNAFKFTPKGEIAVECEQLPHRKHGKRCIYLAVHDTGIGIPDDKLEDIFQAFTQLDGSITRRYSGTGLGLAIVRRLTELMDGTITVESASGKGTSIHCTLSFEDPPALELAQKAGFVAQGPLLRPLDILIVEDDPVNQFTLRTLLKKAGHSSVCVHDGRQAIEALLLHPFECVITDIQMPVMDGVELTLRIRGGHTLDIEPGAEVRNLLETEKGFAAIRYPIPRDLPIIALTAHAMTGDKERFLGMGMDYYLSKPVLASELESILAHVSLLVRSRKRDAFS